MISPRKECVMARKLIVCCDGTWNSEDNKDDGVLAPTNVFKIFNALRCDETQLTRYQSGVGTGRDRTLLMKFEQAYRL